MQGLRDKLETMRQNHIVRLQRHQEKIEQEVLRVEYWRGCRDTLDDVLSLLEENRNESK